MPKETRKKRRKRKGGVQDLCKLYNNTHFPKKTLHSRFNPRASRSGDGGGPPPKEDVEELKKLRPVSGRLEAVREATKKAAAEKAHEQMRTRRARIFSGDAMGTDYVPVSSTDKYNRYKRQADKKRADEYCAKNYLEDGNPITPGRPSRRRRANTCTIEGCRRIEEGQELDPTSSSEMRPVENEQDLQRDLFARRALETGSESGSTGSTGGRRKTRKKKRKTKRKKKRKTKRRRKKRNRKKK